MILFQHREPQLTVTHAKDPQIPAYQMHTHTQAELYCILEGSALYHIEGNTYRLSAGDILLIRPSEAHYIEASPIPYERLFVNFDVHLFDGLEPEHQLMVPYFDRKAGTGNHYSADPECTKLLLAMTEPDSTRATMIANLVLVMQRLCRRFEQSVDAEVTPDSVEYKMIRYINQNLHTDLSVQLLCDRFFLSRAQLCRRFQESTGTSVGRYITVKRMLLARELLHQGQKPTQVSATCGYKDYATFFRAYKSFFGLNPRQAVGQPMTEERHVIE